MDLETDIIFESEEENQVENERMFTSDDEICVVNEANELVCTLVGQLPSDKEGVIEIDEGRSRSNVDKESSFVKKQSGSVSLHSTEVTPILPGTSGAGTEHVDEDDIANDSDDTIIYSTIPGDVDNNDAENNYSSSVYTDYEIEDVTDCNQEVSEPTVPCKNYSRDQDHPDDFELGYVWEEEDLGPYMTKFFEGSPQLLFDLPNSNRTPRKFFDEFFDVEMWTVMSEQTNLYAHQSIQATRGGRDAISAMDNENYRKNRRQNKWKDVNESDMKIFLAHYIIMAMVRKPKLPQYWSKTELTSTPFFGKYMTYTCFENIMRNLHFADVTLDKGKDPLYKLRPFLDMCDRNFLHKYKPGKNLSLDEAACPFKGRLKFRVFNKSKPSKFHIKIYQICEAETGYAIGFEVYTGKDSSAAVKRSKPLDPTCTKTTRLVLGLLDGLKLLDKGHHVYMDNYYISPALCSELVARETFSAGTVRRNRKGVSFAVKEAKLYPGECVFRRNREVLCLKYRDKRPVMFLSTIHEAVDTISSCRNHSGTVVRPQLINDYVKYMRGCDVSDQLLTSYSLHRRSVRWSRKLFFHFLALVINNAYVLFKKFARTRMSHYKFMEEIALSLLTEAIPTAKCAPVHPRSMKPKNTADRFNGNHFPEHIPRDEKLKRAKPVKLCDACNFTKLQLADMKSFLTTLPRKNTAYRCSTCLKNLCIWPCFKNYHTKVNYRQASLRYRQGNL